VRSEMAGKGACSLCNDAITAAAAPPEDRPATMDGARGGHVSSPRASSSSVRRSQTAAGQDR
jgi:hypothetical protein